VTAAQPRLGTEGLGRLRLGEQAATEFEPQVRELVWQALEILYPDAAQQFLAHVARPA
jgi:hypothetical protein